MKRSTMSRCGAVPGGHTAGERTIAATRSKATSAEDLAHGDRRAKPGHEGLGLDGLKVEADPVVKGHPRG
jgi:hypothetical protein